MKTIQKCDDTVLKGCLVGWSDNQTLTQYVGANLAGVAGEPFEMAISDSIEQPGVMTRVVELTVHGETKAVISGSVPRSGGPLYAQGATLSSTPNGEPLAIAMPADINVVNDFSDGQLINIIIL